MGILIALVALVVSLVQATRIKRLDTELTELRALMQRGSLPAPTPAAAIAPPVAATTSSEPAPAPAPAPAAPLAHGVMSVEPPWSLPGAVHPDPAATPGFDELDAPTNEPWAPRDRPRPTMTSAHVLATLGGVLVLAALGFLVATAISNGLLTPWRQVGLAWMASIVAGGAGALLASRRGRGPTQLVLGGIGAGGWFLSTIAAQQGYELIGAPASLALLLVGTVVTTAAALRFDSRALAGFGLLVGCAAPMLVGSSASVGVGITLLVMMAGTALISVRRNWSWIAIAMLVITAPQVFAVAYGDGAGSRAALGALVIIALWHALQVAAGVGFEALHRRAPLRASSLSLLGLATALTAAFVVVATRYGAADGVSTTAVLSGFAAAHLLAGAAAYRLRAELQRIGVLLLVLGSTFALLAAGYAFDGPVLILSWSVSGLLVYVLHVHTGDRRALVTSLIYAGLVTVLLALEVLDAPTAWAGPSHELPRLGRFAAGWGAASAMLLLALATTWRRAGRTHWETSAITVAATIGAALGSFLMLPSALDPSLGWVGAGALFGLLAVVAEARRARLPRRTAGALAVCGWVLAGVGMAYAIGPAGALPLDALAWGTSELGLGMALIALLVAATLGCGLAALRLDGSGVTSHATAALAVTAAAVLYGSSVALVTWATPDPQVGRSSEPFAQAMLSCWWALLGVTAIGVGLARRATLVHRLGAGLLLVAAAKVVLIDTASFGAGLRVSALLVVGLLLLGGGFAYQRFSDATAAEDDEGDRDE